MSVMEQNEERFTLGDEGVVVRIEWRWQERLSPEMPLTFDRII